ncbi:hypothetical protein GCM10009678_46340 [Actinomadura kijaniata]|uniref:Membrane associated rhomboid family serine protease n=1 Tax=Actinomadura namibiensis TaxID=182080 RepID=A0A7W3LX78_ACTNM|nr:hypothetical protein [Actinomadura namibiensis]MBA8955912.1 membrane associated rhomboid family serine protease [Actinomadura namibiensis]
MRATDERSLRGRLDWPLAIALGTVALVRPVFSIAGWSDALGRPATPLLLTAAISLVWILVAGFGRGREPVLTLVAAGAVYALASIALSAALSPLVHGELQGPPATPIAIVPVFLVNVLWGAVCGVCALALRNLRRTR